MQCPLSESNISSLFCLSVSAVLWLYRGSQTYIPKGPGYDSLYGIWGRPSY
jgi:hypothetical protein